MYIYVAYIYMTLFSIDSDVNCSDGCGRTGTYCLIDMVLNRMAKGKRFN